MFYRKKAYGTVVGDIGTIIRKTKMFASVFKAKDDIFIPPTVQSTNWSTWSCIIDKKTCLKCLSENGKICRSDQELYHHNCRCTKIPLQATPAGFATNDGQNGADFWLKNFGVLPEYYISEEKIRNLGWNKKESPSKYAPGKMMNCGIYLNIDGKLPHEPGRIWYEADLNYYFGKRNGHRIVWSNDGLIFVTYDHYTTFIEIF